MIICNLLIGQPNIQNRQEIYYGRYSYSEYESRIIEIDLCPYDYFAIYRDIKPLYHTIDMIEIEYQMEQGTFIVEDSIIHVFSNSHIRIMTLRVIDTLNLQVVHSGYSELEAGSIIHREAAYFNDKDYECGFFEEIEIFRWLIQDIINDPDNRFEILYKDKQDDKIIYFHYDRKEILPKDIYKEQSRVDDNKKKKKSRSKEK
jgi:hypothetical protein